MYHRLKLSCIERRIVEYSEHYILRKSVLSSGCIARNPCSFFFQKRNSLCRHMYECTVSRNLSNTNILYSSCAFTNNVNFQLAYIISYLEYYILVSLLKMQQSFDIVPITPQFIRGYVIIVLAAFHFALGTTPAST